MTFYWFVILKNLHTVYTHGTYYKKKIKINVTLAMPVIFMLFLGF